MWSGGSVVVVRRCHPCFSFSGVLRNIPATALSGCLHHGVPRIPRKAAQLRSPDAGVVKVLLPMSERGVYGRHSLIRIVRLATLTRGLGGILVPYCFWIAPKLSTADMVRVTGYLGVPGPMNAAVMKQCSGVALQQPSYCVWDSSVLAGRVMYRHRGCLVPVCMGVSDTNVV